MLGNRFYSRNLRVALGKVDVSICHWHAVLRDKTSELCLGVDGNAGPCSLGLWGLWRLVLGLTRTMGPVSPRLMGRMDPESQGFVRTGTAEFRCQGICEPVVPVTH